MSNPSIFNDVLGPVMRGPSSSHSAGALRIGRLVRQLMQEELTHLLVEYDPNGALVTTHKDQGTDMGLAGGLMGWEPTDERLIEYEKHIAKSGIKIDVKYVSYGATHANTYKLTLSSSTDKHTMTALSIGGGMIEVINIDGSKLSIGGDTYELIIFLKDIEACKNPDFTGAETFIKGNKPFIKFSNTAGFDKKTIDSFKNTEGVENVVLLDPVLPVLKVDSKLPFCNSEEMEIYNNKHNLQLWELALKYETARSGFSEEKLFDMMLNLVTIMKNAIELGIKGTSYKDRILPAQAPHFQKKKKANNLLNSPLTNEIILSVTAFMEVKSSMGIIVAAPTAGSCGALPGAVIGTARFIGYDDEAIAKALFSAGMIGVFIAKGATFSAEEAGCMAECGSAAGMAAAALTTLTGGNLEQCLCAASVALQNSFGLICDPIGNRVEAPCLGKNVSAASNALSSANMAMADYEHLIPLDEVIHSMSKVGKAMPHEHCCTALGGLAITPTAKKIEANLKKRQC